MIDNSTAVNNYQVKQYLLAIDEPATNRLQTVSFRRSLAVVIGINQYRHGIPRLDTPVNDARRLAQILNRMHGYNVWLLDYDVTRARLTKLFTHSLRQSIAPNDRLLIYFAGHGIAQDSDEGLAGYLIPQDAQLEDSDTFLPLAELHNWLAALPCRHMLAILDCCFSRAFRWYTTRSLQLLPSTMYYEHFERFIRYPAWQLITSTSYEQMGIDALPNSMLNGRVGGIRHSPFAEALFDALSGAGDLVPASKGDGLITTTELYLYLRDRIAIDANRHTSTPGLWPLANHGKGEFVFLVPGQEPNLPFAPELTLANNPYRGLQSYNEWDEGLFFGRTELIAQMAACVAKQPLTLVLGAADTGKSSLVKAGLLPYLRQHSNWRILSPIRPADKPILSLAHLLDTELSENKGPINASQYRAENETSVAKEPFLFTISNWFDQHPDQQLLLIIDQVEELVTLCQEGEYKQFLTLLTELLDANSDHLRIVFILRSDFEPQLSNSTLFAHRSYHSSRFIVPPMNQDELREVIIGPADARVLDFEPLSLVDELVNEVIQIPGALPILSLLLSELYRKYLQRQEEGRDRGVKIERSLLYSDYQELGGVIGCISKLATALYDVLDTAHQVTMRRVMLRMITADSGELVRRRVPMFELIYINQTENERVKEVIERLSNERLVVTGMESSEGEAHVELVNDLLIRTWDKLLIWKGEAEEYMPFQRQVTQAANAWASASASTKTKLLWNNNPRLSMLEYLLNKNEDWFNKVETEFIQQSLHKQRRLRHLLIGAASALIIALTILVIYFAYV